MKIKNRQGFGLLEVIIGVAIFALFAIGIYSGTQYVFKVVFNSRLHIIETSILNEQIEVIRNLPFSEIGIINGSPAGLLDRNVTTTRSGVEFLITRTIRNIDDPFDGTIGGTPNDTAPADYKLIEVEIICTKCGQRKPARLSTYMSPKNLEGDANNGALFIKVFDANAAPVVGATVRVVANFSTSTIDITDTTNNEGMLRIVDLPAGIGVYQINVSKDGYTSDGTLASTLTNPNPTKPLASVAAQDVVTVSFSIDRVSSLNISTINNSCSSIGNVGLQILGTKVIGIEPDVFLINQNISTNSSGDYNFNNLVWDSYSLRPLSYNLLGSIPALPINLLPETNQPVQIILGSATTNYLLVAVKDSITGQPLAGATVRLSASGYDQTKTTGVGFVNQTDWSGGTGQLEFINNTKYWADDGKLEINDPSGDVKLSQVGANYVSSGYLESSVFDLGVSANFVNLFFEPLSQPTSTGATPVRFQIATSNSSTVGVWDYYGPDGTSGTYYDQNNLVINSIHNSNRYLRYKVFLSTEDLSTTPILSDLSFTYITSCTPPGQAYFGALNADSYTLEVSREGYQTFSQTVSVAGGMVIGVDLVAN